MRGSRNFCRRGGGGPGPTAIFKSSTYFTVLRRVFNVVSNKNIIFQGFRGGPKFSRWEEGGVKLIPGGGGSKC